MVLQRRGRAVSSTQRLSRAEIAYWKRDYGEAGERNRKGTIGTSDMETLAHYDPAISRETNGG